MAKTIWPQRDAVQPWQGLLLYSPVLLCVVFMLPRLLSAQFGFFDDPATLVTSQRMLAGEWSMGDEAWNGRFRPVYWLYYALIYRLAGDRPLWFFIGNLVLFMLITAGMIRLARTLGLSRGAAWFAGLSLVLSGPIVENVYTLSKPELQQVLWLVAVLLLCGLYTCQTTRLGRGVIFGLASGAAVLACLTKETGLLLLPAGLSSWVLVWLGGRLAGHTDEKALASRRTLALVGLIGVGAFLALRSLHLPSGLITVGYANNFEFSLGWLYTRLRLWLDWLMRDYLYLAPVGLVSVAWLVARRQWRRLALVGELLVWMILWLGVYIPWVYTQEYYLLPLALGAALCAGLFLVLNQEMLAVGKGWQAVAAVGLLVSVLLFIATLPSNLSNARLQLVMDRANADMLNYVIQHAPPNSRILLNSDRDREYVAQFWSWVKVLRHRSDLEPVYRDELQRLDTAVEYNPSAGEVWVVASIFENQFYPTVRMGVFEHEIKQWNAQLDQLLGSHQQPITEIRYSFRSFNVDPMRFFCPLTPDLAFCDVPNAPADRRMLAFGWRIYRVLLP